MAAQEYEEKRLNAAHILANRVRIRQQLLGEDRIRHDRIDHAINLYELSIVEMWRSRDTPDGKFQEMCSKCCDLLRALPLPDEPEEKTKHVLKLFAYSYLGERWVEMRRVIEEEAVWKVPRDVTWDRRVVYDTYIAILYLIRKREWRDLDRCSRLVDQLRDDQKTHEQALMRDIDSNHQGYLARDLAAYYHLAGTVDILAHFMREGGSPSDTRARVGHHMDAALRLADGAWELETLLIILKAAFKKMIENSIWTVIGTKNPQTTNLIRKITGQDSQKPVYELLYPQRDAIRQHLLDSAIEATVLTLPTSSGKTLLAEFRILQVLNLSRDTNGKVVYVAPTRALVNQVTSRLRRDMGSLGIKVEKMSGAIDVNAFEANVLRGNDFDVLVTTPEKMNLLIRHPDGRLAKDITLTIIDEAHNIADESRGLNMEILVSNVRSDCSRSTLLLMTPFIPNHQEVAAWLNPDNPHSISVSIGWWRPNDRVVGICYADGPKGDRMLNFKPLVTHGPDMRMSEGIQLGSAAVAESPSQISKGKMASLVASVMTDRRVLILAQTIDHTFNIAKMLCDTIPDEKDDEDLDMVSRYVEQEMGQNFELARYIRKGVGIHNAGLPDDVKELVEWLMESGSLRAVVSTTTLAQGMNFPVDTILFATHKYAGHGDMPPTDFWNIAGRVGRVYQHSVGLVGIMAPKPVERQRAAEYVLQQTEDLASRLKVMVEEAGDTQLSLLSHAADPCWSSFLQYVSHLYLQAGELRDFIYKAQTSLEKTYGYGQLTNSDQRDLLKAVEEYAENLDRGKGDMARLSDITGLNVQSVETAMKKLDELTARGARWGDSLLSGDSSSLGRLLDIVFQDIPETKEEIQGIKSGTPITGDNMGKLVTEWMRGTSLHDIATNIFGADDAKSISKCVRIIYNRVANSASWGLAAMLKIPQEGISEENTKKQRQSAMNLPAKIYYGVDTDAAVLMRLNSVPRSIAKKMGAVYESEHSVQESTPSMVRKWISDLDDSQWNRVASSPRLSSTEYRRIWERLSGEGQ